MKKGFTLIELMVVIVIIGILAAIAVPKMFGMSAKAKAAEVGPAVGSWSKMEAAYILEKGEAGSFASIGYTPPGGSAGTVASSTTNFDYSDPGSVIASGKWQASSRIALNNCSAGAIWAAAYGTGDTRPIPTLPAVACAALTPNFPSIQ